MAVKARSKGAFQALHEDALWSTENGTNHIFVVIAHQHSVYGLFVLNLLDTSSDSCDCSGAGSMTSVGHHSVFKEAISSRLDKQCTLHQSVPTRQDLVTKLNPMPGADAIKGKRSNIHFFPCRFPSLEFKRTGHITIRCPSINLEKARAPRSFEDQLDGQYILL